MLYLCVTLCCSCAEREKKFTASSLAYFDTYSEVTLYASVSDVATFDAFCDIVWSELETCHRLFDIYHEYNDMTNLCTVNRTAGVSPVSVDLRIMELLEFSKQMYTRTDGKTNIALGSVLEIWHAYREEGTAVPDEAELRIAAAHTDIDDLILDSAAGKVYFADPLLKLDVGAVAKGYAAGRVYHALIDAGYTDFFLNIGGSILSAGTKPGGSRWRVGVELPDGSGTAATLTVTDCVLVTSGDYQRYYEVNGVRYCHIINPETLFPARDVSSVTVYADDAALADALSTALFCMNYVEGERLLSRFENCEALWVLPDGTVCKSDGFPAD